MSDGDNPETGPLTIDQALDRYEASQEETTEEAVKDEPTETPAEEVEVAEADNPDEAGEDAEPTDNEAPEGDADDDAEQTLTLDEYGEVRVQIGEEVKSLAEIAELVEKGTLRQSDYTRKTMDLAEERKALEAEKASIAEKQQQLDVALLEAAGQEPEPDWVSIMEEDPIEGPIRKERWLREKGERDKQLQEAQQRQAESVRAAQEDEKQRVVRLFPEWTDQKTFMAGEPRRVELAEKLGYSADQYAQIQSPLLIGLIELAARGMDSGKAAIVAEKKIGKAPKVLRPGQSKTKAESEAATKAAARDKLRRPHSLEEHLRLNGVT